MTATRTMSAIEYADHRSVAVTFIHRLRRRGLIVMNEDGRIDVDATDKQLNESLDPVRGGKGGGIAARIPGADDQPPAPAEKITVNEAVRRERLARAQLSELELLEKTKQLTPVDEVNRAIFTLVRQAINRMQGMSGRLRAQLANETDPHRCGQLLDAEVAELCTDMRRAAVALLQDAGGDELGGGEDDAAEDESATDDDAEDDSATDDGSDQLGGADA